MIYTAVVTFYVLLFFAVMWPVYPLFATIEPRILGMPHSLFYVVGALVLSFVVLLGLFHWEETRGLNAPIDGGEGGAAEPGERRGVEPGERPGAGHGGAAGSDR